MLNPLSNGFSREVWVETSLQFSRERVSQEAQSAGTPYRGAEVSDVLSIGHRSSQQNTRMV